ncbi:cytochrome P450 [Microtetraspora sp. NBRC 13810]|uniref:cytochrome P450 family protein n=1 Tax=Microtetraspora sp. NBRC 13810 TaxID=3030990 RepID=UPI0024A4213E|nr:cytochrome P450 [Microtetraspora sp. NBRC 13810]GLW06362.1 cytochrome P450 [Microtetraspora sp. NBRC 13810]
MPDKLPFTFLFDPEFAADPHAMYGPLRELGPVHPIDFPPGTSAFLILDYEHGRAALNDPRLSKDMLRNGPDWLQEETRINPVISHHMLVQDPPDHTRQRRLVARAFTPRRVEELRPRVAEITDELIDAMVARGEADLIADFAVPLPITVICELIGIPVEIRPAFREWSQQVLMVAVDEEQRAVQLRAVQGITDTFTDLIASRRAAPREDLVSALIGARDDDGVLSEEEVLGTLVLLMIAGHETTVNLIGSGMAALLREPAQLRLLRERPELLPSAVEELLRLESPVERSTNRIAVQDLEIAGTPIPAGSFVHVSLAAASRDPKVFPEPDRLDLAREGNRHIAFGHGVHFCLGAPLARLEGQIAFGALLSRLPGIALACPPEDLRWSMSGSVTRGLVSLPVRF